MAFLPKQTHVRHYPKHRKLTSRDPIFTLAKQHYPKCPWGQKLLPHWCNFLLSFQSLCWELKLKFPPSCCPQLYKLSDSYLTVFKDSACRANDKWSSNMWHAHHPVNIVVLHYQIKRTVSVIVSYSITAYDKGLACKIPDAIPASISFLHLGLDHWSLTVNLFCLWV